jgi:hypothetical protein
LAIELFREIDKLPQCSSGPDLLDYHCQFLQKPMIRLTPGQVVILLGSWIFANQSAGVGNFISMKPLVGVYWL